jgi:hypothetical protein
MPELSVPAVSPGPPVGSGQGVVLRTAFFILDWTLRFVDTIVIIDGHRYELPWGEHFVSLETGPHQLQVSYPYLHRPRGKASINFNLAPGEMVEARYRPPISVLGANRSGRLTLRTDPA